MTAPLTFYQRFLTTFRRFPQILQNLFESHTNVAEHIFRKFFKITEDFQRLPKTFEEYLKMFRSYTNEFKYNLRDKLDISEVIIIFIRHGKYATRVPRYGFI